MKRMAKFALVVLIAGAALLASAPKASALNWCLACYETGECIDCCICDGGTITSCATHCEP